jgi:hypothetical protein
MKIKIIKCKDMLLWYRNRIGEEFEVQFVEDKAYWTREGGTFNALNWVYKEDATITEGNVG